MLVEAWGQKLTDDKTCSDGGGKRWPVLVIDEANKLTGWSVTHSTQLAGLLSFLVRISKETNGCHVLMATSEYGFQTWLNTGQRGMLVIVSCCGSS